MVGSNDFNDHIQVADVCKQVAEVSEGRVRGLLLQENCCDGDGSGLNDKALPKVTMKCNNFVKEDDATDKELTDLHLTNGDLYQKHNDNNVKFDESEKLLEADKNHVKTERNKEIDSSVVNNGRLEDEKDEEIVEKTEDQLPIDRGWAWVILLASVCVHFIIIGQLKCFGIIFVQLMKRYGSSTSTTSVIFTLMNATYSVSALIIMTVGGSMSARTSFFIGGTIASVASMITAFIDDVNVAMVTIGVASGVANAFVMTFTATIINTYFVEKRGFANNIGNCGVSLGTIVLAPIVTKLFEHYSYTGTYIILTGLNLQLFVIACLLRPMSFYEKRSKLVKKDTSEKIDDINGMDDNERFLDNGVIKGKALPLSISQKKKALSKQNTVESRYFSSLRHINENLEGLMPGKTRRRRAISESEKEGNRPTFQSDDVEHTSVHSLFNSEIARFVSTDLMNTSMMDLTLVEDGTKVKHDVHLEENSKEERSTRTNRMRKTFVNSLKKLFDVTLLSKPDFQYFLICNAFLCSGCSLATAFLAPLAYDNGIDNDMVALMISIMSIIELLSRFVVGYISDKKWFHRSTIIAIACLILGVAAEFLHFMTTFATLMIYVVIAGLLQGVYFSLFVVVILDILSFDDFKGALGFTSLVQGISSGICMPIIGYLKDTTGTYVYPYNMVGACLIIGAILTYFIPNVHEWSLKREKNKNKDMKV